MKRVYEAPAVSLERFVANEYIAACGDSGTVYNFVCDAGNGKYGEVYLETNGVDGLQTRGGPGYRADQYLSGYTACGITHEAETTDVFLDGYYVTEGHRGRYDVTPVIVWRGENNDNTHCTTHLDKNTWETAKS